MRADKRMWRTSDGRLVDDGDADAVSLAYAAGDEITERDQAMLGSSRGGDNTESSTGGDAGKARTPASNKSRRPAADK
jgi:hypothetical protein